jgi:gluconolactonase
MTTKISVTFSFLLLSLAASLNAADFEIKNEAGFKRIIPSDAKVEKLAGEMGFLEGPTWNPAEGGFLIFSDIPNNELKKWTKADGVTTVRRPSNNANGNTIDLEGRLVTAEHSGRRISVTEKDGTIKTAVDRHDGKKLNSPNDVVVKSDGTIWFTDPDYGLGQNPKEQEGNYVYRYDPKTDKITAVVKDFDKPNGLCFSPDEKKLYVADSGRPRHIRVFDVQKGGTLSTGKVFCAIDKGGPDGIRCDADGRIWSSAGDGIHIFAPDGSLIGKVLTPLVGNPNRPNQPPAPESPANLCFGGSDGKRLFITARKSLYAIQTSVTGAKRP